MTCMLELRTRESELLGELAEVRKEIEAIETQHKRGSEVSGTRHLRQREREEREREAMARLNRILADVSLVSGMPRERILDRSRYTAPHRFAWWWLAHNAGDVSRAEIVRATGYHYSNVTSGIDRALDVPEAEQIIHAVVAGEAATVAAELGILAPLEARTHESEVAA